MNEPIRVTRLQFRQHAEAYLELATAENRQINIGTYERATSTDPNHPAAFLLEFVVLTSAQALQASREKMERTLSEQTGVTGGYRLEQLPVQGEHGWILNRLVGWHPRNIALNSRLEVAVSDYYKRPNELTLRVLVMSLVQNGPMLGTYVVIPRDWSGYDSDVFRDALLKMLDRDGAFVPISEGRYEESEFSIPRLEIPKD